MKRLDLKTPLQLETTLEQLHAGMQRRLVASPPGLCPVETALNYLELSRSQSCGKCVPCRIGLAAMAELLEKLLDGEGNANTVRTLEETAASVADSADCAIGVEAANAVLLSLRGFRDDYMEHAASGHCLVAKKEAVPCRALCPADVDIPGYIALIREGRNADAVRLIRKDNPFPVACAYICEHPCENHCRRKMVDDAVSIRALKRYAVEMAGEVPQPPCAPATGKKVAVIGGGPGGLTAAYFLALMGHKVTVFERRKQLGGMMRYGIPSYRFPREVLDAEIRSIVSSPSKGGRGQDAGGCGQDAGIEVRTGVDIGRDISFADIRKQHDAVFISIGAHTDKKLRIEGEESEGVISAVALLRGIGDGEYPDFTGKRVVVVGGGNVAMDCTRSAVRLGAAKVTCAYRRRIEDMTAQREEVEGAIAEGAEVMQLAAPLKVEADANGKVAAFWVKPQIIGEFDKGGRPAPKDSAAEPVRIPCDIIIVAIGQGIDSKPFEAAGIPCGRGGWIKADDSTEIPGCEGVFAGGDVVTGPATVIKAIAAGKVAAANIDAFLGFHHEIKSDVQLPLPRFADLTAHGRVNPEERPADERKKDFACMECPYSDEAAAEEAARCLRCDCFGFGNFKGGRIEKW
ncbi:MAG: FAD-dependent oxidoreductase [Victivallales bacterium]|nr:FAD-dependent oxidoreductase [Victivallales bacterium]